MRRMPLVIVFAFLPFFLQAQSDTINFRDQVFSPGALNNIVNKKLNGLVSGQPNGTLIGNYAAFDPAAGSFTFKGTMAFDKHSDTLDIKEDYFTKPANVSFLSLNYKVISSMGAMPHYFLILN